MGVTYLAAPVTGPTGVSKDVKFLVDSGAQYTLLPEDVWNDIGLQAKRTERFTLVDGTVIERDISECRIKLDKGEMHTPVILGQPDDAQALLGVITLEEFGLMLNPFNRALVPMNMVL